MDVENSDNLLHSQNYFPYEFLISMFIPNAMTVV